MKKACSRSIALLVCLALFLLAGCGSSGGGTTDTAGNTASTAAATVTPAAQAPATATAAPAAETPAANTDAAEVVETITLVGSNGSPTNDIGSIYFKYWCDQIEELSGGTIKVDCYLGGTLAATNEEFDFVKSGSVDFILLLPFQAADEMALVQFPIMGMGGDDLSYYLEFGTEVITGDPDTSAAIEAQGKAAGVKILGVNAQSPSAIVSRKPFESISELFNLTLGCLGPTDVPKAQGFTTFVTTTGSDMYDSLSRGVFDCISSGYAMVYSNALYEVAPYVGVYPGGGTALYYTFNYEKWASLTEAQQAIITQAMENTQAFAIELLYDYMTEAEAAMAESGATVFRLSQEDGEHMIGINALSYAVSMRRYAETQGVSEAAEKVLAVYERYFDIDLSRERCEEVLGYS